MLTYMNNFTIPSYESHSAKYFAAIRYPDPKSSSDQENSY